MSDTDKDKPYWVTAEEYMPFHTCQSPYRTRKCNLPAEPVRRKRTWRTANREGCVWTPVWDRHSMPAVPKWYVDHIYHNPQRRAARDNGRHAVAEYRATGTVDRVYGTDQARGAARWYYW